MNDSISHSSSQMTEQVAHIKPQFLSRNHTHHSGAGDNQSGT